MIVVVALVVVVPPKMDMDTLRMVFDIRAGMMSMRATHCCLIGEQYRDEQQAGDSAKHGI